MAIGTAQSHEVSGAKTAHLQSGMAFRLSSAVVLAALFFALIGSTQALAQDRTLSLYNTHTHERLTVTYKRNGRFVQAGLNQLNRFLRDWRRDEVTRIDPDLFDIIWTVYREVRASEPIHVVSAYRSPATNNMLRRRSSGVANNSQHTQGRAIDFFIPGISAAEIRAAGLRLQAGGVGYYPRSNTPFVHLDTGSVRMWPRMTRSQLARVFPNGRTVHIPADGQPMPGFEQAQRDLQRSGGFSIATRSSASRAQNDGDGDIVLPTEGGNSLLAALFGGGRTEPPAAIPTARPPATAAQVASTPQSSETASLAVASLSRDPYTVPSPVLPPYASADGTWSAPSTVAGLSVPAPTPAPTIDEIQLAALGTPRAEPSPRAIALENAFATAQSASTQPAPDALPPVTRAQQIAQTVPAPGQIAAIIEARFAEQRASQASLAGQVARAIQPAGTQAQPALTEVAAAATADSQPQVDPLSTPGALDLRPQPVETAAAPRFVPPPPVPAEQTVELASVPAVPSAPQATTENASREASANSIIAAAFAAQSDTRTPAQSAIDLATRASEDTAGIGQPFGITGRLYPIADDLTPGLAKHSIRGAQHAHLIAPSGTVSLSPIIMQATSFVPSGVFQLQTNGFGNPGN